MDPVRTTPPGTPPPADSDHTSGASSHSNDPYLTPGDQQPPLTPDTSLKARFVRGLIITVKVIASPFVTVLGLAAGLIGGILMGIYRWGITLCDYIAHFPRRVNKFCIPCTILIGVFCGAFVLVTNLIVGSCSGAGLGSWYSPYHMWTNEGCYRWYKDWFDRTNAILQSISANCG